MKISDKYTADSYDILADNITICNKAFPDLYTQNTRMNDYSIAYAKCRGEYASLSNIALANYNIVTDTQSQVDRLVLNTMDLTKSNDNGYLFLCNTNKSKSYHGTYTSIQGNNANYFGSVTRYKIGYINDINYSGLDGSYYNWCYNGTQIHQRMKNTYFWNGFRYNTMCICVRITAYNDDFSQHISNIEFDDYYDNYYNEYKNIVEVEYSLFNGTKSNRNCYGYSNNIVLPITANFDWYSGERTLLQGYKTKLYNSWNIIASGRLLRGTTRLQNLKDLISAYRSGTHSDIIIGSNFAQYEEYDYSATEKRVRVYFNITREQMARIISCCGLYWAENSQLAKNGVLGSECVDDKIHLPIPEGDGYYTGGYLSGTESADASQATWGDTGNRDLFEDNGIENPDYQKIDKISLTKPKISALGAFNKTYAITLNSTKQLSDFLWNSDENIFNQIINGLKLLGANPINGIIDVRLYPFDLTKMLDSTQVSNILLGRTPTPISGIVINNINSIINLGTVTIEPKFNNFLDYPPYTTLSLYIPYLGVINLDGNLYMNKTLDIKLIIDFLTGAGTAVIYNDDKIVEYHNLQIGCDIMLSGDNSAQYSSNLINSIMNFKNISTENLSTLIQPTKNLLFNIDNVNYQSSGHNTPSTAMFEPQFCYLIINRPVLMDSIGYGKFTGYACNIYENLSNVTGYTICNNVKCDIPNATSDEISQIKNLLETGVYL